MTHLGLSITKITLAVVDSKPATLTAFDPCCLAIVTDELPQNKITISKI
jgi:hypothetical protein